MDKAFVVLWAESNMGQLEYGDYYKFVASAGIALIAGAVVVPWMFLREPFDLAFEVSKIALFTPEAQSIIHERQHLVSLAIRYLPLVSGFMAAAGCVLTVLGLNPWRSRQTVRDKNEDFQTEALKRGLESSSPAQIEEKTKNAIESADQANEGHLLELSASEAPALVRSALAVEQAIQSRLHSAFDSIGTVMSNQRLGNAEFDAIIKTKNIQPVIVELKYIRKGFNRGWFINTISNLSLRITLYAKTFDENPTGFILIVIATSNSPLARRVTEFERELHREQPDLMNSIRVRTIYEEQIAMISDEELRLLVLGNMA